MLLTVQCRRRIKAEVLPWEHRSSLPLRDLIKDFSLFFCRDMSRVAGQQTPPHKQSLREFGILLGGKLGVSLKVALGYKDNLVPFVNLEPAARDTNIVRIYQGTISGLQVQYLKRTLDTL
jgi:hypothetical protein